MKILDFLRSGRSRKVVYTCMFGYSEPFADFPLILDGETDAICFTDDRALKSCVWQFRYLDTSPLGPIRTSKKVKILAHEFVGDEYAQSLYIDNRVEPKVPIAEIFSYLNDTSGPMVVFRHPERECIYDEAKIIIQWNIDNAQTVNAQMDEYRRAGFSTNAGLIAGSMLLRRHDDVAVQTLMESWFQEVMRHSYRDQLSFNYVAWRNGFVPSYFPRALDKNDLMNWPIEEGPRLPRRFSDLDYLALNPDVKDSKMTPREHYINVGAQEGRRWRPDQ